MRFSTNLRTTLAVVAGIYGFSHLPVQGVQLADGTVYFAQPPSLVSATTTFRNPGVWATYYFTLSLPKQAGEPLQTVTFTQQENREKIRFNLEKIKAFVGTSSDKGQQLALSQVGLDPEKKTVSLTFNPPISPGETVTIGLRPAHNPYLVEFTYLESRRFRQERNLSVNFSDMADCNSLARRGEVMTIDKAEHETMPLHTMNPQGRFSERAADYAKYRPTYPTEVVNCILAGLEQPSRLVAADMGAGTGISSRLLAERGIRVLAIEPNVAMRQAASSHPLVEFHNGSAEHTNLPDASVSLIVCFQSFHWFDPKLSLREFRRILQPTGRLAVVWNDRDQHDDFTQQYSHLVQVASNYHPAESRLVAIAPLLASSLFSDIRRHSFVYRQELDQDSLVGRAMSVSYVPRSGLIQQQLVSDLHELYNRCRDQNGKVYLVYRTSVYMA